MYEHLNNYKTVYKCIHLISKYELFFFFVLTTFLRLEIISAFSGRRLL